MFGDVAETLLKMMGQSGVLPGALVAKDVPAALERLKRGAAVQPVPDAADAESGDAEGKVSLKQRAFPLVELLGRCVRAEMRRDLGAGAADVSRKISGLTEPRGLHQPQRSPGTQRSRAAFRLVTGSVNSVLCGRGLEPQAPSGERFPRGEGLRAGEGLGEAAVPVLDRKLPRRRPVFHPDPRIGAGPEQRHGDIQVALHRRHHERRIDVAHAVSRRRRSRGRRARAGSAPCARAPGRPRRRAACNAVSLVLQSRARSDEQSHGGFVTLGRTTRASRSPP